MAAAAAKRWTPDELSVLEARQKANVHPETIAKELGRTVSSVVNRIYNPNKRRSEARARQAHHDIRVQHEYAEFPPPPYVLREREIRLNIEPTSVTQVMFADPLEGYSALDNKARKISVQDALEICALHTGKRGDIMNLAATYHVSTSTIQQILNGTFFDRLIKKARHS